MKRHVTLLNLCFIILAGITIYIFTYKANYFFHEIKVPTGDSFSYTLNLFYLLNKSTNSFFNYLLEIFRTIASSEWYYAYKIPVAILAPILTSEPHILIFINYIYLILFLSSIYFFLTFLYSSQSYVIFLSVISIFMFPWFWGLNSILSLQVLTLDPQFYLIGSSFFITLLLFSLNMNSKKIAIFSGILGGLFIFSRGNSLFYFIIIVSIPYLFIFYNYFKKNNLINKKIKFNLITYFLINLFFIVWYYFFTFENVKRYYSFVGGMTDFSTVSKDKLLYALKIIYFKSPGIFFTNSSEFSNEILSLVTTLIFYLLLIILFIFFVKKYGFSLNKKINIFYICVLTFLLLKISEIIYITPYINNVSIKQGLAVSLIPLTPIYVIFITNILFKLIRYKKSLIILTICFCFSFATLQSYINTNYNQHQRDESLSGRTVNGKELETFSLNLNNIIGDKTISILFYNIYNPVILDYYRIKNNFKPINKYQNGTLEKKITRPFFNKVHIDGIDFENSLLEILNNSDYILIPKNIDDYKKYWWVTASQYTDIFKKVIASSNSPEFSIKFLLHDSIDLVLLEKIPKNKKQNYTNVYSNNIDLDNINIPNDLISNLEYRTNTNNFLKTLMNVNNIFDLFEFKNVKLLLFGDIANDSNFKSILADLIFSSEYLNFSSIISKLNIDNEFYNWLDSNSKNESKIVQDMRSKVKKKFNSTLTEIKLLLVLNVIKPLKKSEDWKKRVKSLLKESNI